MKKIAVLGPIPRDTIITYKNEIIQKYGCVTHPAIALSRLMEDQGEVVVVSHVHKKDKEAVQKLFSEFLNVNLQGLTAEHDRGTVIELKFTDQNNRLERQTAFMDPILPKDVKPFLDSDIFIFVPITDFEISLSTLRYIKKNSNGLIIFDAHGPTTSLNINGTRERKYWVELDQWLPYIDILKMNLEESQCCWFKNEYNLGEMGNFKEEDTSHLDEFAEHVLDKGAKILYVTLDSKGCVFYTRREGNTYSEFIKSVPVDEVVDTTGCGDSFAGGLGYGFGFHADPVKAGQYANTLGALRTQGKTYEVFKNLEETEALMAKTYS